MVLQYSADTSGNMEVVTSGDEDEIQIIETSSSPPLPSSRHQPLKGCLQPRQPPAALTPPPLEILQPEEGRMYARLEDLNRNTWKKIFQLRYLIFLVILLFYEFKVHSIPSPSSLVLEITL